MGADTATDVGQQLEGSDNEEFSYEHVSLISSNTGSEDSDHVGSNDEELSDEQ